VKKTPAQIIGQKGPNSIVKSHEGMTNVECSPGSDACKYRGKTGRSH